MANPYRSDFPIFQKYPGLAYLDNAATTQRPRQVIDAISNFYSYENANIHRGIYDLSNEATRKYEEVRSLVAQFMGSAHPSTIGFTKGTTESINIIARSFIQPDLKPDENIVTTLMEHHANFLPWQVICKENKAELRMVNMDEKGGLDLDQIEKLLDQKTKILSLNHISNTLGTINQLEEIIGMAHAKDIPVLIDAAQSAAFYDLDVKKLNYDFLAFSGHKIFGPFGIGVLYASQKHLKQIKPYNYGGGMIQQVAVHSSSYLEFPQNLEAGTSNITGVMGLGEAIRYVNGLNKEWILDHLKELTVYGVKKLGEIPRVSIVGSPKNKSGIISFVVEGIHPHDIASFLNKDEIAVRAGMHCTQPLLDSLEIPATIRASFSIYNSKEEVDRLHDSLVELIKFWS